MRLWPAVTMAVLFPVLVVALALATAGDLSGAAVAALLAGAAVGVLLASRLSRHLQRPVNRIASAMAEWEREAGGEPVAAPDLWKLAAGSGLALQRLRQVLADTRERQQEVEAILGRMADGVLVVDDNLSICRINPAAAALLAVDPTRVLGRTIIEATVHHGLDALFRDAMASGHTRGRRMEIIQPRRRVLQALVTPLEELGGRRGAVAVLQDLTEMDRLERTRRDFVTNVSHELRTPVTTIKVMAESLERGALAQPEVAQEFVRAIGDASERLARLVDDVLVLARVEVGPGRAEWHTVAMDELIEECINAQRPLASQYGVTIEVANIDPASLSGDPESLRQAVTNLLVNAIKYNRAGGVVRVSLQQTAEGISLQVADTGIGIAPEHQTRVFERFYRVDRGRSREVGGTGLGLAIVKHVAETHGGHVHLASQPDHGSTFTLFLPTQPDVIVP